MSSLPPDTGGPRKGRLADVARQAGVSEATVSRVLNGRPGVSPDTRQLVVTALDVLGYERPALLRGSRAGLVGLIVPELENPIFPAFAQAIESVLAQHGYTPVLCTQTPGGVTEEEYVDMLLQRSVRGIIFVSGRHADATADLKRYQELRELGLPVVLVNGHPESLDVSSVTADDDQAMRQALRHLVSLGHRRIGLAVGQSRYLVTRGKVAAFLRVLPELVGITSKEARSWVENSLFTVEGGHSAARHLVLERGATGLVCGSDLMALGAIRAVRAAGLRVPEDVSVVGYDDSMLMSFTDPPLTTVRQPVETMSRAAVQALADEIAGHEAPRQELLFAPELIVRASTAAAPASS